MTIIAIIFYIFYVENKCDWWIDIEATCHVCSNQNIFSSYDPAEGLEVLMGNQARETIIDRGKVLLCFSHRRNLLLIDVLYVPTIQKDVVSSDKLNKAGL